MKKKPPSVPIEPEASNAMPPMVTDEMREMLYKSLPKGAHGMVEEVLRNGLAGALGFPGSGGQGYPGNPYSEQLSNSSTLFKNLRWYFVSNFRQLLSECYVELGLIQTVCRVPVDDALRGGIEIKSQQLDEEQVQDLQVAIDRDDILNTVAEAGYWNRLFGGAGILVLTDQDPRSELDLTKITEDSPLEFRAVDMWELFWDMQSTEGYDPEVGEEDCEFYDYYSIKLHRSRVMVLKGMNAPSFLRPRLRGWGFSVVEALVRSINQYLKATDLGFEVLDEFKLDVYKIKNLVNTLLSPNGQQQVQQRIQLANWQKNYQNALVMDSEDDFGQKQLSFAGLAETMAGIRTQVASDMRIPESKLFGSKSSGLNNDDESDLEVYNAMVESEVRSKMKYDLLRICEIKCQQLFGMVPDDLSINFMPLRVLSAVDEEEVKTHQFNRLHAAVLSGHISLDEFRDACNRDELLGIQLKKGELGLSPQQDEDEAAEGEGEPEANEDTDESEAAYDIGEANEINNAIKPYTQTEKFRRMKNSAAFDKASYEADGGDGWIDSRKAHFYENPMGVDEALWMRAKMAGKKALGTENWKFTLWMYRKLGGIAK